MNEIDSGKKVDVFLSVLGPTNRIWPLEKSG